MNNLISKQGFNYIISILDKGFSRDSLEQILNSIVEPLPDCDIKIQSDYNPIKKSRHRRVKHLRKDNQIKGILKIINSLKVNNIIEIGCGNGRLSREIALNFPYIQVKGIDYNSDLINKQNNDIQNLSFETNDALLYETNNETDLIVALHTCGSLADRVIDIALDNNSSVICTPCCYGKIEENSLPRSKVVEKEIFKSILRREIQLEGEVKDGKRTIRNVFLDLYRMLINFDRIFYLQERSYNAKLFEITSLKDENGYSNSSLRHTLVCEKYSL